MKRLGLLLMMWLPTAVHAQAETAEAMPNADNIVQWGIMMLAVALVAWKYRPKIWVRRAMTVLAILLWYYFAAIVASTHAEPRHTELMSEHGNAYFIKIYIIGIVALAAHIAAFLPRRKTD